MTCVCLFVCLVFQALLFLHFFWVVPLYMLTVIVLLYKEIGYTALSVFATTLILIPLQAILVKQFARLK